MSIVLKVKGLINLFYYLSFTSNMVRYMGYDRIGVNSIKSATLFRVTQAFHQLIPFVGVQ